jgi:catechol 2,3-dioxygenase-like lactoylglutathione lyase family enzyme
MTMINHVSIGVSDIGKAKSFYDAALRPLGYSCLNASESSLGYGKAAVAFWISHAKNPVKSDMASGLHFCFDAPTRRGVDAFHKAALAFGGSDNGKPGLRTDTRDPPQMRTSPRILRT